VITRSVCRNRWHRMAW